MAAGTRPGTGHGLLLVHRPTPAVSRWLRQGLVATTVVRYGPWTGVTLAEERARSAAPYDVGLEVLLARSVPRRARPALAFAELHGRAVITVQGGGLRPTQRWAVWQPGVGVVHTPSLLQLTAPDLVAAAGARVDVAEVAAVLASGQGEPVDLLATVVQLLGLPGGPLLLRGDDDGASDVEPSARGVLAFDRLVAEEADHRAEWEAAWGGRPPRDPGGRR